MDTKLDVYKRQELYSATTYFLRKISMNCTSTAMTRMNTMVCR